MDKYLVVGDPIAHSKSPEIHQQFAEQTEQHIHYDKLRLAENDFDEAVKAFASLGGKGMNITVPFKEKAYALADELSDRARLAGAVNTLVFRENGRIYGDNTDGAGLVSDIIERLKWTLSDKRVLVLGAGGAVKGVLLPLLKCKPKTVVIANRTAEKAVSLAEQFSAYGNISGMGFMQLDTQDVFDVVINGTSAGLSGEMPVLPPSIVNEQSCVYDMVYAKEPTACLRWAAALGVSQLADGLGMLVGQAAESFYLWRSVKPDPTAVLTRLKSELK